MMKNKFLMVAVSLVVLFSLVMFFWPNTICAENMVQSDIHDHDAHDHDKHDLDKPIRQDEHDEEENEEGHGEEIVRLTDADLEEFGIILQTAQVGVINQYVELPGEIVLNSDQTAHVVSRVVGTAKEVKANVGDQVSAGQLLAVLESRELAEAKASYFAAVEREILMERNFSREERLRTKNVNSERDYLDARQALAEARNEKKSKKQQLLALGVTVDMLNALSQNPDGAYTHFEIYSPLTGTVIEKHLTLGETIDTESSVFTIADLSTVWVNLDIYQKDLISVRKGQTVKIEMGHGIPSVEGTISWISPLADEATRTTKARVVLPNSDGSLRPGLFVTAKVAVSSSPADLVVPKSALQTFEGKTVVFVKTAEGFEPRPVEIGRENEIAVEILSGLAPGQTYVAEGAFTLKAQLSKGAFGDGHNH